MGTRPTRGAGWGRGGVADPQRHGEGLARRRAPGQAAAGQLTEQAALGLTRLLDGREAAVQPGQVDGVEARHRDVLRHPEPEGLGGPDDTDGQEVGLGDDSGGAGVPGDVEEQAAGRLPLRDVGTLALDHRAPRGGGVHEAPGALAGVGVDGLRQPGHVDPVGRSGAVQRHRHVGEPPVPEVEQVARRRRHGRVLVDDHVTDGGVHRRAGPDDRDAAREQVVHERAVRAPAEGEHRRVHRMAGDRVGALGAVVGDEQHARARGVELLREAVEHGERKRVPEGVAQALLDDDRHGPRTTLAQRAGQRVGPGVAEVGRRGAHPGRGGVGHGAAPAEDERGGADRDPRPGSDVAQRHLARLT